ncbi:hypothetical protein [Streptomyces spirodelae]|uniref:Transposase n=1 Tax=Streptomyces spirodelae TaxID=2812904 RepID=A0ABS3X1I1_9ACTN|nr:hypothetical protein [Streptomyces spirodelae]MBO8189227.1 hypothetical protein [Streptomyces spirodelae]
MTSIRRRTSDPVTAYPEPPACSAWGKRPQPTGRRPLSPAEQDRNREQLAQTVHTRRSHSRRA